MRIWLSIFLIIFSLFGADGFDDEFSEDEQIKIENSSADEQKDFDIYGSVSYTTSYNYAHTKPADVTKNDFRGFSSSKLSANLKIRYKISKNLQVKSTIKAFKDFIYTSKSDEYKIVPDWYDEYVDINELYLERKINNNMDVTAGRQIISWGKSDTIVITDILNPIDNTTPAMVDIKDLKLGRMMARFGYYSGKWSFNAIMLIENRFSKQPKYGSDFAPANKNKADNLQVQEPGNGLEDRGIALSASGNLEGQDISFYYANQYIDNKTYRSNILGTAYNIVVGSFLFKTEAVYFDNYDSNKSDDSYAEGLVGIEYNGISDGSISLEAAKKNDYTQYALRATQSYINQTLDASFLISLFGGDIKDGGFARIWSDYDYDDDITITVGLVDYIGGDSPRFKQIKDNDRVFATLRYSF